MQTKFFEEYKCIYDDNNNLLETYENNNLICRYLYDEFSRLIREDNLLLGSSITYSYNKIGKIAERNIYDYSLSNLNKLNYTDRYTYSKTKPYNLIMYNDEKFDYDKFNNPTIYRNAKLKWSNSKNLLSIDSFAKFKYNKNNNRTIKTIGDETTTFYLKKDKIKAQNNGIKLIFIFNHNEICGFSYTDNNLKQTFLYKKNFNGDIVGIYNSNNELICKYIYDAFGNHKLLIKNNNEYVDISLCVENNKLFSLIANLNPYRFKSQYFDIETGLYYMHGKYYDSEIGSCLNNK